MAALPKLDEYGLSSSLFKLFILNVYTEQYEEM